MDGNARYFDNLGVRMATANRSRWAASLVTAFVQPSFLKVLRSLRDSAFHTQDVTVHKAESPSGSTSITMPRDVMAELIADVTLAAQQHKNPKVRRACRAALPRLQRAR